MIDRFGPTVFVSFGSLFKKLHWTALVISAFVFIIAQTSNGRAETIFPTDRDWSQAEGWTVYWNAANETCFAEQAQANATQALLGTLGKDNRLALGFRNDKLDFAKKDKTYTLKLSFDGRPSWDAGMSIFDPGNGAVLLGSYGGAAKLRAEIAKARKLTLNMGNKTLAAISLKGTSSAFKAVDACRKAKGEQADTPVVEGNVDSKSLVEANKLTTEAIAFAKEGNYAKAEPLFRRAFAIVEKALGPEHIDVARSINNLAALLSDKGDLAGAEPLSRRGLAITEKALGPDHPDVASDLSNLANIISGNGDLAGAEPLIRRALAIREKSLGLEHPDVFESINNLANLLYTKGDLAGAEPLHRRALSIGEKSLGAEHPDVAQSLYNLATLLKTKGDLTGAEPMDRRALAIQEKALGPDHPFLAGTRNGLGDLLNTKGDPEGSLALARRAAKAGHPSRGTYLAALFLSRIFMTETERFAVTIESFEAVQQTVSSEAGTALRSLSLRASADGGDLARLVRNDQDLTNELTKLESAILTEVSKQPTARSKAKKDAIRTRTAAVTAELAKIREELTRAFPDYLELSRPAELSLVEAQQLLAEDEALIVFDIKKKNEMFNYVWAVTRNAAEWKLIGSEKGEIADRLARLRTGLDLSESGRAHIDPAKAHELYTSLLGPVEDTLVGKSHLIFVLNGAVSSLPPQVLVTKPPTGTDLRNAHWLVRDHAITVLPTVSSLKLLRSGSKQAKADKPFIGYGDPVFDPENESEIRMAARGYSAYFRGSSTDIDALKAGLPRLPGTGKELRAVAESLGADKGDVILREAANEAAVKTARLANYNIVYFATHGLVAGEVDSLGKAGAEPALALTIPDKATELNDGLLTASEVAGLKLNADWVVLSACNTAAEGKPGAGALSGLARAFFYAGARSLLVSHWVVDDDATAELMSRTFAYAAAHPERRQAEALRQAMLSVMDDPNNPQWADPGYWGAFVLVGEAK